MMYHLPSTWRRLMAHFLDKVYTNLLSAPVWISVVIDFLKTDHIRIGWPHILYLVFVSLGYETLSMYFYSTTLGKWQWDLKVISRDQTIAEDQLGFVQSLTRVLTSRLSFYFGWSIFALSFFKLNRTHLSDWVANTQVVSTIPRKSRPQVRWILALGFIFLSCGESLKTAAMTINALSWQKPFVYFESSKIKKMLEDIEIVIQTEDDEY